MNGWELDKEWSDQFLPEIKKILGLYLIDEPPIEEDQKRNTDLIVLKLDAVRVGCRIRRVEKNYRNKEGEVCIINYLKKYGNQFTIRAGRPNGGKTELAKIIEGWGDYFFYGFGQDGVLHKWSLCRLNVFRLWYNRELYNNKKPGQSKDNKDNSSFFIAFDFNDLPEDFIVKQEVWSPPPATVEDKHQQPRQKLRQGYQGPKKQGSLTDIIEQGERKACII